MKEGTYWVQKQIDWLFCLLWEHLSFTEYNFAKFGFFSLWFINYHADVWYYLIDQGQSSLASPLVGVHMLQSWGHCWSLLHGVRDVPAMSTVKKPTAPELIVSLIAVVTFSLFNQQDKIFACAPTLTKKTKYISKWKITSVADDLPQFIPAEMCEREATCLFIAYLGKRSPNTIRISI